MKNLALFGFVFNFFPGCHLSPVETLVADVKLAVFVFGCLLLAIAIGIWRK